MGSDEIDLVESARQGCEKAFGELYDLWSTPIFRYLRGMVSEDVAEEILQETFVKVARKIGQLREAGKFKPWLFQIATNLVKSRWRSENRFNGVKAEFADELTRKAATESKAETRELILDGIAELPKEQAITVNLVYFQGMSHRECGEICQCPEGTVSWRLSEARKYLRDWLTRELNGNRN